MFEANVHLLCFSNLKGFEMMKSGVAGLPRTSSANGAGDLDCANGENFSYNGGISLVTGGILYLLCW